MDWGNMIEEVLDLILSKVSHQDRYTFSEVCHSWYNVAAASPYRSPCLMFTNNRKSHMWKLFQHNAFFSMDFPRLDKDAVIRCSKHGWLLMSGDDETIFFFDPFKNRMIELPTFGRGGSGFTTLSFFHPPTSPNCFIIGIESLPSVGVKVGLLRNGDGEWDIDYMKHIKISRALVFWATLATPILHSGKLYFVDITGKVATLDVSEDRLRECSIAESGYIFRKCLKQRRLRRNIKEHYLVKPMGDDAIFAVFVMHDDRKVRVFRLLEPNMQWEPIDDLGDMVFYVSNASSFGYKSRNKSLTNKIFFPRVHDDKVVFYSLDTKNYHCFGGEYSSEDSYTFKRYDDATWMMLAPIQ